LQRTGSHIFRRTTPASGGKAMNKKFMKLQFKNRIVRSSMLAAVEAAEYRGAKQ
jgi:hypothetical protein